MVTGTHFVGGLYNPNTFCDPFLVGGLSKPDLLRYRGYKPSYKSVT